jgi:hypothetical protein
MWNVLLNHNYNLFMARILLLQWHCRLAMRYDPFQASNPVVGHWPNRNWSSTLVLDGCDNLLLLLCQDLTPIATTSGLCGRN